MSLRFSANSVVVYPTHGVGTVTGVEAQTIGGNEITTYVIEFEEKDMVLSVPIAKAEKSGLRNVADEEDLQEVNKALVQRPKSSKGMWSRRAKEYESKINSGNIVSVAEVVRDLHKNVDDPERSYSERIIYENALERLSHEIAAIKKMDIAGSSDYVIKNINDNNPYFIKKAEEAALKKAEEEAMVEMKAKAEKKKSAAA